MYQKMKTKVYLKINKFLLLYLIDNEKLKITIFK